MSGVTITLDAETRLDTLCYRFYGTLAHRVVERVLEANPLLAQRALLPLPRGLRLVMPPLHDEPRHPSRRRF